MSLIFTLNFSGNLSNKNSHSEDATFPRIPPTGNIRVWSARESSLINLRRAIGRSYGRSADRSTNRSSDQRPSLLSSGSRVIVYIRNRARISGGYEILEESSRDNPARLSRLCARACAHSCTGGRAHERSPRCAMPCRRGFHLSALSRRRSSARTARDATTTIMAALTEIRHCFPCRGGTRRATMGRRRGRRR